MTREEEINKAYDKWQDDLECSERTVWQCACRWADEHPKNPWRDAEKELPPEIKDRPTAFPRSEVVFVRRGALMRNAYYDYLGKLWRTADKSVTVGYVTHWMPIPELPKGGEV